MRALICLLLLGGCSYARPPLVDAADARLCEASYVTGQSLVGGLNLVLGATANPFASMQSSVENCLRGKGYRLDQASN